MKQTLKILSITSTLLLLMGFTGLKSKTFRVEILQNGQPVKISNNIAELEKKEFQIRITLKKQDGVFMNASFQKDYFDLKETEEIKDYKWLNQKTHSEENFNKDKTLIIDDETVSYLFYDKKENWHRFDKEVKVKRRKVIGTKTIKYIEIRDTEEVIDITNVDKDIYLFFVATEKWEDRKTPKALGRLKVQLKWK
jgi:hypothetical protein